MCLTLIHQRPLFWSVILFSLGLALGNFFIEKQILWVLTFILLIASIAFIRTKRLATCVFVLIFLGSGCVWFKYIDQVSWKGVRSAVWPLSGETYLKGIIVSAVEERENRYGTRKASFVLRAQKIRDLSGDRLIHTEMKVKVYLENPPMPLAYGTIISMKGVLEIPSSSRNPGAFDVRNYLDGQGIHTIFYSKESWVFGRQARTFIDGFIEKSLTLKEVLSDRLEEAFEPRDASFLKALFLGVRSDMDPEFRDLFLKTGTLHILSVSGFNIGFLWVVLFLLLKPFPISKNIKLLLTAVGLWSYCLMVGWQAPVLRATLMASVFILGKVLGRKTDLLNTLGTAAWVILILNPKQLFDLGFQLSFLSVFGMIQFLPQFIPSDPERVKGSRQRCQKMLKYLKDLFWVSLVCFFVTLPLTVQTFYFISPMALVANMFVVPVAFLLFFLGAIYFSVFWIEIKIFHVVPLAIKHLMNVLAGALAWAEAMPGSYLVVGRLNDFLFYLLFLGIFIIFFAKSIKKSASKVWMLLLFSGIIFLSQGILRHLNSGLFKMTMLDVGQGEAIYCEFPYGGNLLIDAGPGLDYDAGRLVVTPFLRSKGVRSIDAVVISHSHEDHQGGLKSLIKAFQIKNIIKGVAPSSSTSSFPEGIAVNAKTKVLDIYDGLEITGFKGVKIQVLSPASPYLQLGIDSRSKNAKGDIDKDTNDQSVVLKMTFRQISFLLTGDIKDKTMGRLLREHGSQLASNVLKVPHHGSKVVSHGEVFLHAVSPGVSLISSGKRNAFGLPSQRTISILKNIPDNQVFNTAECGAIEIYSDGTELSTRQRLLGGPLK